MVPTSTARRPAVQHTNTHEHIMRSASQVGANLIDPTTRGVTRDFSIRSSKTSGSTAITATGAVALTVAQLKTKVVTIDPGGAGRALTFPTAAEMVAGGLGLDSDGDRVGPFTVINTADAAENLTPGVSTGVTLSSAAAFGQSASADFYLYRDSATAIIIIQR